MTRKLAVALALAVLAAAAIAAAPLIAIVLQPPASISWDAKNAYVKCDGAIADPAQWPQPPDKACAAMALCANEATLSTAQSAALKQAAQRIPGCGL